MLTYKSPEINLLGLEPLLSKLQQGSQLSLTPLDCQGPTSCSGKGVVTTLGADCKENKYIGGFVAHGTSCVDLNFQITINDVPVDIEHCTQQFNTLASLCGQDCFVEFICGTGSCQAGAPVKYSAAGYEDCMATT